MEVPTVFTNISCRKMCNIVILFQLISGKLTVCY